MNGRDLVHVPCRHSVKDAVVRLKTQLQARELPLIAEIDCKARAAEAGLTVPESTVVVFGAPAQSYRLIDEAPELALDLHLRILIRDTKEQRVLIYRDSRALAREHGLDEEHEMIAKLNALLQSLTESICA